MLWLGFGCGDCCVGCVDVVVWCDVDCGVGD